MLIPTQQKQRVHDNKVLQKRATEAARTCCQHKITGEGLLETFIAHIARTRGVTPESLVSYRGMMTGTLWGDGFRHAVTPKVRLPKSELVKWLRAGPFRVGRWMVDRHTWRGWAR